jgi:hypothetical protein
VENSNALDDDDLLFKLATPLGFSVRSTVRYWNLIVTVKHPVMRDRLDDVKMTLSDPDEIRQSRSDPAVCLRLDRYQTRSSRKTMTPEQLKTIIKESVREALREEWLKFYQLNRPHVSDTEQAEIEANLGIPTDYDEDDFIDITDLFDHAGQAGSAGLR